MFDTIEKLKSAYTDKLVAVDDSRAELARFSGLTGKVKTVNMNGRALVEFDAYNNIGWYDISLDALRVIDQPLPKVDKTKAAAEKPAAKASAEAPAAPTKQAPAEPKAAPTAGGKPKMSTADILAAARSKAGATPAPAAAATAAVESAPAPQAAATKAPAAAPPGKPTGSPSGKPTTTAEKIAWCRAHDAKGGD